MTTTIIPERTGRGRRRATSQSGQSPDNPGSTRPSTRRELPGASATGDPAWPAAPRQLRHRLLALACSSPARPGRSRRPRRRRRRRRTSPYARSTLSTSRGETGRAACRSENRSAGALGGTRRRLSAAASAGDGAAGGGVPSGAPHLHLARRRRAARRCRVLKRSGELRPLRRHAFDPLISSAVFIHRSDDVVLVWRGARQRGGRSTSLTAGVGPGRTVERCVRSTERASVVMPVLSLPSANPALPRSAAACRPFTRSSSVARPRKMQRTPESVTAVGHPGRAGAPDRGRTRDRDRDQHADQRGEDQIERRSPAP